MFSVKTIAPSFVVGAVAGALSGYVVAALALPATPPLNDVQGRLARLEEAVMSRQVAAPAAARNTASPLHPRFAYLLPTPPHNVGRNIRYHSFVRTRDASGREQIVFTEVTDRGAVQTTALASDVRWGERR